MKKFCNRLHYVRSEHEKELLNLLGSEAISGSSKVKQNVLICFTNRCGSNFLAEALASTGKLPQAGEFFNAEFVQKHCRENELSNLKDYIEYLQTKLSQNDVFCSKVGVGQLFFLHRMKAFEGLLNPCHFIFVQRHDVLGQAISFSIANQTKIWTSQHPGQPIEPQYDPQDIWNRIDGTTKANMQFERFFAMTDKEPIRVVYETLVADFMAEIYRVGQGLGLGDLVPSKDSIRLKTQRNHLNESFRESFLANPIALISCKNELTHFIREQGTAWLK